jgi:hypothetical protein
MARPKKYTTDAERLEARRASNRKSQKKYYQKRSKMDIKLGWLKTKGFTDQREYHKQTPSYKANLKNTEPGKFKDTYAELPSDCKAIPNWPTYYAQPNGEIWRWSDKRKCYLNIKQQQQKSGYMVAQIYDVNNKRHVKFAHILMCETFIGSRPLGMEVDHIDRQRDNNNISNLRWLTKSANMKRRLRWKKTK